MIVTTRFPDLPPRPQTAANAAFRQRFAERWAREDVVFMASTARFESQPLAAALSVRLVEQGAASLVLGRRRLLVEPGQALVVNEGERYAVSIAAARPVHCLAVHFRPGLAAEVAAARQRSWARALDDAPAHGRDAPRLLGQLQAPSPALRARLAAIAALVRSGERDAAAYEAPFIALLDLLLDEDTVARRRLERLDAVRAGTRAELGRRAGWARDFILSHYAEPIGLADIAAAAHLSKYHLLRVFHQLYGVTPHALLRERRARAAAALIEGGAPDLAAVAEAAGFGSRWAMQRALRLHLGRSGRELRGAR